jgi:hypothetical protein
MEEEEIDAASKEAVLVFWLVWPDILLESQSECKGAVLD